MAVAVPPKTPLPSWAGRSDAWPRGNGEPSEDESGAPSPLASVDAADEVYEVERAGRSLGGSSTLHCELSMAGGGGLNRRMGCSSSADGEPSWAQSSLWAERSMSWCGRCCSLLRCWNAAMVGVARASEESEVKRRAARSSQRLSSSTRTGHGGRGLTSYR